MRRFLNFLFIYAVVIFGLHLYFGDWPWLTANVEAQSGRTFYIDAASGSNSFDGTEKTHTTGVTGPWKSHPYMQTPSGCSGSGSAPSYAHQAGDTFIFKGGVTWVASCFPMSIVAGGSSNVVRDTYTVDQTWFSGGSFTKPIFAGQNVAMDGMILVGASNINLSYLDVGGWKATFVNGNANGDCDQATIMVAINQVNVTASNVWLHDWLVPAAPTLTGGSVGPVHGIVSGGMCAQYFGHHNIVLDQSEVSDAANIIGGNEVATGTCGGIIAIQYTNCHDLFEGIVNHDAIHDNEFNRISWPCTGSPPNVCGGDLLNNTYGANKAHSNIVESSIGEGDGPVYNNYIHNIGVFGEVIDECAQGQIYNNTITGPSRIAIRFQWCTGDSPSSVAYVMNNTVDGSTCFNRDGDCPWDTYFYGRSDLAGNLAIIKFQNNISIGTPFSIDTSTGGSTATPNRQMNTSEATAYGFVPANKYAPSSSDPFTVGQGANLSSLCSGGLSALCLDPRGAPWFGASYIARGSNFDIGAFQFAGGPVGPPSSTVTAPTNGATISGPTVNLTATCTPQGTATVSNIQFFVDGISFGAAGSSSPYTITLDSTKIANGTLNHTISDVCTDSNSQTGTGGPISVTVNNSAPNCFTTNPTGATQQGFTAQTATYTATWDETPNSTGTNDVVVGMAAIPATAYSQISALLRSNTSGFWDAWNNAVPGYTSVGSAPYVGGTTYSFSGTFTFVSGNLVNYSISETAPSSIVIASGYTPRAAATSLAYLVGISDAGVYDTAKVCNLQIGATPTLSYSPGPLNFGPVVNTMTSTLTESVSITNPPAAVSSAVVAGTGFSLDGSSTCPTSGSIASSCTYVVDFTPPSTGSYMGTLTIPSNATGSPQVINLSGSGIPPAVTFSLSQNSLNFGAALIHTTVVAGPISIVVANGPSTGSTATLSGPNAADFSISPPLASNTWTGSVASSAQTRVSFTPTCGGGQPPCLETATLTYASGNATSTAPAVTLTGTGSITIPVAPGAQMFMASVTKLLQVPIAINGVPLGTVPYQATIAFTCMDCDVVKHTCASCVAQ